MQEREICQNDVIIPVFFFNSMTIDRFWYRNFYTTNYQWNTNFWNWAQVQILISTLKWKLVL